MFTEEIAGRLESELRSDPDFNDHSKCFAGSVVLNGSGSPLRVDCRHGQVSCSTPSGDSASDISLRMSTEVWDALASPSEVNVSLTRMLRQGDVEIGGDIDAALHHWQALFWMVNTLRRVLSGVSEY